MPQFLLFGYFGAGNFGDEWTLASFLKGCQQFGFERSQFIALSRNPSQTTGEHGVSAIPRDWRAVLQTARKCEAVIGCGGSLLQDVTSFRSLLFYCLLVWLAKAIGKKVALVGQGLGPLKRPLSRKIVKATLNACDLVTFREPASFEFAQKLGAHTENCSVTADLTFVWDELPKRGLRARFGVNLRPLRERWDESELVGSLTRLLHEGERVLLLPLQPGADDLVLEPLAKSLPADWWRYEGWFDGLKGIASVGLLVAMRLHALIAACLLAVPFVGLNYDPKVANILGEIASGQILPLSAKAEEIVSAVRQVCEEWDSRSGDLSNFVEAQRNAAGRNFELLAGKVLS